MRRAGFVAASLLLLFAALQARAPAAAQEAGDAVSFAVLKADRVNVRRGPGFDHAVQWVYNRRGVPVAVIDRFEHWRHIRDMDGDAGWVHFSLLDTSGRGAMVRRGGDAPLPLRAQPRAEAQVVALLQRGMVLEALQCLPDWCRVGSGQWRGWVPRASLWGIAPGELF